jgi:hypothetical protein
MAFLIPYSLITQGLCTGIVTTISAMTVGSYKVIKSIYNHQNSDVQQFLKKLDIERKLALIEAVITHTKGTSTPQIELAESIEPNEHGTGVEMTPNHLHNLYLIDNYNRTFKSKVPITDPIHLCLTDLSNIITEIHLNLKTIDQKVRTHHRKWFHSYRSLNVQKELDKLECNVKILNDRYEDLIKISVLMKS